MTGSINPYEPPRELTAAATFAHDDDWQTFLDFIRAKFPRT
jgi:hypothetical protein